MNGTPSFVRALARDESGQDLVEYVLILTLISLAAVSAMEALGQAISQQFQNTAQLIDARL